MLKRIAKALVFLVIVSWLFLYHTNDAAYYFTTAQVISFQQYWDLRVSGATPENARRELYKNISKEYYESYLPGMVQYNQERLAYINSGFISQWEQSTIYAKWRMIQFRRWLGVDGFLYLVTGVFAILVLTRFGRKPGYFEQDTIGLTALFRPLGWYRIVTLIWLMLLSEYLRYILMIPVGQFTRYLYAMYYLMVMFFAVCIAILFHQYFLKEHNWYND